MDIEELLEEASTQEKDEGELSRIRKLAEDAKRLEDEIAALDERKKCLSGELNEILQRELPDLFAEVGVDEIGLPDGTKYVIKDFVSGSLPKGEFEKEAAIAWIEQNGGAETIKATVNLSFGKSEYERAKAVARDLAEQGFEPSTDLGMHPSTLQAFVREKLKNGEEVPTELLGVYVGRRAKIVK